MSSWSIQHRISFTRNDLTDQEQARLANLEALRAAGIEPYPARVKRTHTIADARALYEGGEAGDDPVSVTGRLKRIRVMGKMSFADLEDGSGSDSAGRQTRQPGRTAGITRFGRS